MSETDEVPFVDVAAVSDVAEGSIVLLHAVGRDFLLCNAGGTFYATASRCTHAAWELARSELAGAELVCSLHGGGFDLRTGAATRKPATKPLRTFRVEVRDGRIHVAVPSPPHAAPQPARDDSG